MDTALENQAPAKPSGIRAPSKVKLPSSPSRFNGLSEMSDSAANSRGAMGPPNGSIKHKPSGLPEPPHKQRKTLAERGGECGPTAAAPTNTRPVNNAVKATIANGARGAFSASTSRMPSANSSRNTSASSFNGSVGSGIKGPGANGLHRARSAYGHVRSKSSHQGARPATSMAQHDEELRPERKGAYTLSISTNPKDTQDNFKVPKRRTNKDKLPSTAEASTKRIFSSVSTPGSLSLLSSVVPSSPEGPAGDDCDSVLDGMSALTIRSSSEDMTYSRARRGKLSGKNSSISLSSQFPSSHIPRATPKPVRADALTQLCTPTRSRNGPKNQDASAPFVNRFTNDRVIPVFDTENRMDNIERQFEMFKQTLEADVKNQAVDLKETIKVLRSRVHELESIRAQLMSVNEELRSDVKDAKSYMSTANLELESTRRNHTFEVDDLRRKHNNEIGDLQEKYRKEADRVRKENEEAAEKVRKDFEAQIDKLLKMHTEDLAEIQKRLNNEVEEERMRRLREVGELQTEYSLKVQSAGLEADTKERETQNVRGELINVKSELDRERALKTGLQGQLSEATTHNLTLDAANKAMKAKIDFLESDSQAQSQAFNDLHRRMQEAIEAAELANEKLRQEETLRRKLHNQVQELKGNIRVMCRVRPTHVSETEPAKIAFPDSDTDSKEVSVQGPEKQSAMGNVTTANHAYSFDRVFGPTSQNGEVFEEISQLVQSALDGYNVCIFCYGQTGSGKTFTMSSADGMIPRATAQIYAEATRLEEKGWRYKMEGSFVEVYNETYNDLLGRSEDLDKKKVEVRHDAAKKTTTLENTVSVALDSPSRVEEILKTADKNRSVAATKANSRSSRSHSVFILKLVGENSDTGERSEGTLNLVDLAGSERLEHSKAEGARLKETQNINKSLSCLGDVINALGNAKEGAHIPYRNSKLTYLLQYSLGGNSKTLMFVMVSPLQAHLQETVTSLKFATKVLNTHIGTAKKMTRA
ncbi:kinesin-domain-containing protein [Polyplosphaeria fusca]|uniref:Kinesin-like protein n=1 Tax=Polyplosphaeria fusca TaxID=682080 RepID=A0A9P4QW97_9PLEO|nr:kinesin-domain-containing protein [Polyplosphaeria fusca]